MTGNGDLHAKNLSLRWTDAEQLVAPTPAYDLHSTIPYPLDTRMAMEDRRTG
ncbi:MAG: HipA domain-containing protein [Acidimicrobiia bacterium]